MIVIILNVSIAIVAIFIALYILKKDLSLFLLSFMILIQYIWMFFSITVIESGIYINEQGRNGYFVYSSVVLFLFYISTIMSLIFFKKVFNVAFKNLKITKFKLAQLNEGSITFMILLGVFIMAFFNLLSSPIPIFSERVSKFNFWDYAQYPFLKSIIGNVMAFVAFGAMLLYRYNKKISIILISLYFIYLILLGQKFTGFLIGIYGILIALYHSSKIEIKFKLKWLFNKYLLITIILLFGLVLYKYTIKEPYKYMGLTPFESVFYRAFGLQAHVFWGVTEQYVYLDKPHSWDITELWKGMHILMFEFWPFKHEDFISVTNRNVSWTNAYPSILIRIFPLGIALIVNFLLVSFVAVFQVLLSKSIKGNSYILSIIFFQLLVWVNYGYTMAYFYKLKIPFILLILYFIYKYIVFYGKQKRTPQ